MYRNKLNREWNPCKICKWNSDRTTEEEYDKHCKYCNDLASEWEESNEFKQFKIGVAISKAGKKIQEAQENARIYPLIIMCTEDVKDKFLSIDKLELSKKGFDIIETQSTELLGIYTNKYYTELTPIFIVPCNDEFRDYIYHNSIIMDNCKVFTVFPNFNHTEYIIGEDPVVKYHKISKKEILNLKLDRRFDQIAFESYQDLKKEMKCYNIFPEGLIF